MNEQAASETNEAKGLLRAGSAGVLAFVIVFTLGDILNWASPRYFPAEHLWSFTNTAGPGRVAMALYGLILYATVAGVAAFAAVRALTRGRAASLPGLDRALTWLTLAVFTAAGLFFCVHLATRPLEPVLFP